MPSFYRPLNDKVASKGDFEERACAGLLVYKNAAKRPGANEGGREEEERPGIACQPTSELEDFATMKLVF